MYIQVHIQPKGDITMLLRYTTLNYLSSYSHFAGPTFIQSLFKDIKQFCLEAGSHESRQCSVSL